MAITSKYLYSDILTGVLYSPTSPGFLKIPIPFSSPNAEYAIVRVEVASGTQVYIDADMVNPSYPGNVSGVLKGYLVTSTAEFTPIFSRCVNYVSVYTPSGVVVVTLLFRQPLVSAPESPVWQARETAIRQRSDQMIDVKQQHKKKEC